MFLKNHFCEGVYPSYHTIIPIIPNNLSFLSHHSLAFVVLAIQKGLIPLCLFKCQSVKSFIFPTTCDLFYLRYIIIMYILFNLCQYKLPESRNDSLIFVNFDQCVEFTSDWNDINCSYLPENTVCIP